MHESCSLPKTRMAHGVFETDLMDPERNNSIIGLLGIAMTLAKECSHYLTKSEKSKVIRAARVKIEDILAKKP